MVETDSDWVVLAQYRNVSTTDPLGPVGLKLLFVEEVLRDAGIDSGFDPWRPGEGPILGSDFDQPIRLMVRALDLDRARGLARVALAAEPDDPGAAQGCMPTGQSNEPTRHSR